MRTLVGLVLCLLSSPVWAEEAAIDGNKFPMVAAANAVTIWHPETWRGARVRSCRTETGCLWRWHRLAEVHHDTKWLGGKLPVEQQILNQVLLGMVERLLYEKTATAPPKPRPAVTYRRPEARTTPLS